MGLTTLHWLSLAGLVLSMYFLYVKEKHQRDKGYKPLCDITSTISCSKAAEAKESNLFVLPNAFYGVLFYIVVFGLVTLQQYTFVFFFSLIASIFSLYLIYTSFRVKVACPVCTLVYLVNFLMVYFSYPLF